MSAGANGEYYYCHLCQKRTSSWSGLILHIKMAHNREEGNKAKAVIRGEK